MSCVGDSDFLVLYGIPQLVSPMSFSVSARNYAWDSQRRSFTYTTKSLHLSRLLLATEFSQFFCVSFITWHFPAEQSAKNFNAGIWLQITALNLSPFASA